MRGTLRVLVRKLPKTPKIGGSNPIFDSGRIARARAVRAAHSWRIIFKAPGSAPPKDTDGFSGIRVFIGRLDPEKTCIFGFSYVHIAILHFSCTP